MIQDRDQVSKTLGGPELRFLSFAARFEDLVKDLDLPSQGIPFELLDSIRAGADRQICDQLPFDFFLFFGVTRSSAWITVKVRAG